MSDVSPYLNQKLRSYDEALKDLSRGSTPQQNTLACEQIGNTSTHPEMQREITTKSPR